MTTNNLQPGKLIRLVRLTADFDSQEEFGQAIGASQNTISSWENDRIPRSWLHFARILQRADDSTRDKLISAVADQPCLPSGTGL